MKIISVEYDYWVRMIVVVVLVDCIIVPWHNTISPSYYYVRTVGTIEEDAFYGTSVKAVTFGG